MPPDSQKDRGFCGKTAENGVLGEEEGREERGDR